ARERRRAIHGSRTAAARRRGSRARRLCRRIRRVATSRVDAGIPGRGGGTHLRARFCARSVAPAFARPRPLPYRVCARAQRRPRQGGGERGGGATVGTGKRPVWVADFTLCKAQRLCYSRTLARVVPGSSAVEQPAVNRLVDGSNPSRGAILKISL